MVGRESLGVGSSPRFPVAEPDEGSGEKPREARYTGWAKKVDNATGFEAGTFNHAHTFAGRYEVSLKPVGDKQYNINATKWN